MRVRDAPIHRELREPHNQARCKEKKPAESYREPEHKTLAAVAEQPGAGAVEARRQAHELRSRPIRERAAGIPHTWVFRIPGRMLLR